MTYTVNELISGAYYASGIVSREFETVSGTQIANGLRWLNELLNKKVIEPDLIPYEGSTTFNSIIGQEEYNISNLIKPDTLTFVKDTVRYPVDLIPRNQYHGRSRVQTIESLPYQGLYDKELGGCKIFMYWLPDEIYTFTIYGIFRLADVALGDDLDTTLDKFYINYLRIALADKICTEYSKNVPSVIAKELAEFQALISKQSRRLDMSVKKQSTLHKQKRGFNWAYANLGRGYWP